MTVEQLQYWLKSKRAEFQQMSRAYRRQSLPYEAFRTLTYALGAYSRLAREAKTKQLPDQDFIAGEIDRWQRALRALRQLQTKGA